MYMKQVTFIVFGGTGDLTKRKLVPAFGQLVLEKTIETRSLLVGIGRSDYTDDTYRTMILESLTSQKEKECVEQMEIKYFRADTSEENALTELPEKLNLWEKGKESERIFYLATTYQIFPSIIQNIEQTKLHQTHNAKIVFEKPFGHNAQSSQELESQIHSVFDEANIYRIDHYLGKETVQNINIFKFTNPLIDSILTNNFVRKIEVIADENLSVGNRLGYYDGAGATKDMIQSHLLQVASIILMERPTHLDATCIHDKKVEILQNIVVQEPSKHLFGQYESYETELKEFGLKPSQTETFSQVCLSCNTKRWDGVDIVLRSGKNLNQKIGQVIVHFKGVGSDFSHDLENIQENRLVIDIHPQEDIKLFFNTKKRDHKSMLEHVEMNYCGTCHFGPNTTDGYKMLIKDVIHNEKTLFTRNDELAQSWRITDDILSQRESIPFVVYKNGSKAEDIGK